MVSENPAITSWYGKISHKIAGFHTFFWFLLRISSINSNKRTPQMFGHAFWVVSPHKVEQNTPQHSPTLCQNLMLLQRKRKLSLRRVQNEGIPPRFGYVIHQIYPFSTWTTSSHLFCFKKPHYTWLVHYGNLKKTWGNSRKKKAMQAIW